MLGFVGEGDDFRFDAGAIARADALDLTVEEGRIRQTAAQHLVRGFVGKAAPAGQLLQGAGAGAEEGEAVEVILAHLFFHVFEVYASSVNAHRCPGFHPSVCDAVLLDGFCQFVRSRFGHTSPGKHDSSDVHQPVQEGTGGDDDALGVEGAAPDGEDAPNFAVGYQELPHGVLPDVEVGRVLQHLAPCPDELVAVALGAGAPHGRAFRAVQQTELDGCLVGHSSCPSAQSVYFANDLPLGYAADGRIATHLTNLIHIHRDETGARAQVGRGGGGFASGVAGAYHDNVVIEFHAVSKSF